MSVPPGMLNLPGLQTATPGIVPQDAGMGAAIGQDTYGVQHGPPADDAEFAQRKEGFNQFLAQPQVRAFLLQAAASMLSPRQQGESDMSHVVNGVTQGAAAAGRVNTNQEKSADDAAKLAIEQQRANTGDRSVDVQGRSVDVQDKSVENTILRDKEASSDTTRRTNILSDQADTAAQNAADELRLKEQQLEIERGKLNNEAGILKATQEVNHAKANYYNAAAGAQNGTGKASELKFIAGAIKAKNPNMSDADAVLQAQAVTSGTTRADRVQKMFKIFKDASMPGDDDATLLAKAGEAVDNSLGVGINASPGTGDGTADGTGKPTIPPDVAAAAQPYTSAGAQFQGVSVKSLGGKQMQIFTFKTTDGKVVHIPKPMQ